MQTIINSIPGYRVYEYLLVLSPHEELWNTILKLKENFAVKYQTDFARRSKPHVTLANFLQYEMKEERVMKFLTRIAMSYLPFKIELKDFGSEPSHTIRINVENKLPIQQLVKEIRIEGTTFLTINDDLKPYFINDPHITIGRKLTSRQYKKAWAEYSKARFTGYFIAEEMTLLKRPADELKYVIAARIKFESLPVELKEN